MSTTSILPSDVHLSEHFTLYEFLKTSVKDGIRRNYEYLEYSHDLLDRLRRLANVLETIRFEYNGPIIITSGLRCPYVNSSVGGVYRSRHLVGLAVDITASDYFHLVEIVSSRLSEYRFVKFCPDKRYIHIDINPPFKLPNL